MKRVLVYSHDTFGLGNLRRMLEISSHLVASCDDVSVLLVTGSPAMHAFRVPDRIDTLKLPSLARDSRGAYGARTLPLTLEETVRMRSRLIRSAFEDFDPDLVLVDKKPFGVEDELAGTLASITQTGRRRRMVLLLRDILDSPERTNHVWRKNGYFDAIETTYDDVLVVGDPRVFDLALEYGMPPFAAAKVSYCGYLRRRPSTQTRAQTRQALGIGVNERLMLVTPGGGEDGVALVDAAVHGWLALPRVERPRMHVVTGPEMSSQAAARLSALALEEPGLNVQTSDDDMMALHAAADVVLCMGGYNTVCEVLSSSGCAVIVPRTVPSLEQAIRADRLACLGRVDVLHSHALTPDRLMQVALQALARGKIHAHGPSVPAMDGLERVTRHLSTALGLEPRSDARARSRRAAAAHPSMHAGRQALR